MKKWFKHFSIVLNVALLLILIFTLQDDDVEITDLSKYTQNDLTKALDITQGMSITDVLNLMGPPVVKEINSKDEEWHYCKTGYSVDEYISIKIIANKVSNMSFYVVSWLDIIFHYTSSPSEELIEAGGMIDCKLGIRWGTYDQKTPNKSIQHTTNTSSNN